jgi:Flp pilus assembly protein TadD
MLQLILALLLAAADRGGVPSDLASPARAASEHALEEASDQELASIAQAIAGRRLGEAFGLLSAYRVMHPQDTRFEVRLLDAELKLASGQPIEAQVTVAGSPTDERFACRLHRINGHAAAAKGQSALAISELGALAEQCHAADWRDWDSLGQLLANQGERDASHYAFENALTGTGQPALVRAHMGRALLCSDDLPGAVIQLTAALRADPANREVQYDLDFITGMRGERPVRAASDNEEFWAGRLSHAAEGARRAGRALLSRSLSVQALMVSPKHDARLFDEATAR